MPSKIINIHIPKTAGSAFNHRLNKTLQLDGNMGRFVHLYDERPVPLVEKYAIFRAQMENNTHLLDNAETIFFSGHYRYRDIADVVGFNRKNIHWVTFLRDPITRALSDYFFSKSDRNTAAENFRAHYKTFDIWFQDYRELNKQTECLRPTEDASVDDVISLLQERFSLVGLTEHADSDFDAMMNALGLRSADAFRSNQNPDRDYMCDLLETRGDELREVLAEDIKLYEAFSQPDRKLWTMQRIPKVTSQAQISDKELASEIENRAPWNHKIRVRGDIWTGGGAGQDATGQNVSLFDTQVSFNGLIRNALPNGMEGRSFLDCGCNGGGYCFAAKDRGASKVVGFDARDHWLDQANFVRTHRTDPSDGIEFHKGDLLDLSFLDPSYDVTWFSGILYHLPDPVTGLKNAADRTSELLFVNTAVEPMGPDETEVPAMKLRMEGVDQLMSGIYRLAWYPSGPKVIEEILTWLGFPETRLLFWNKQIERPGHVAPGRLAMVAARAPGRLENVPNAVPENKKIVPARV